MRRYKYPTEEGIINAIEEGWDEEQAKRGFDIFDSGFALEIMLIDDCFSNDDLGNTDYLAAKEAEKIGFCKIIPYKELPKGLNLNERHFGYIDTPENRKAIENYCNT